MNHLETTEVTDKLEKKGIKPTPNRILVLKALMQVSQPINLTFLEEKLDTMDKSSIFRTLTCFLEHGLVHSFEDGRGILNYELCTSDSDCCNSSDAHFHFYCESCHQSYCLKETHVPQIPLPEGFTRHAISFVIKGECATCRGKLHDTPISTECHKQSAK